MTITGKSYLLKRHFVGLPKEDDFCIKEETVSPLVDGEYLIESLFLSVDPYMRPYSSNLMKEGDRMIGHGVGRVIQSQNEEFPVGTIVVGPCRWSTHYVPKKAELFRKVSSDLDHISYAIGVLGSPGISAYFGFLDICDPKPGEFVFVNAAAGAVGSIVGQIAKIKGCYVVGCAGSDAKIDYLKEIGFDGAFNYKTENLNEKLKEFFPEGIDCFFENVGGEMFDIALTHMRKYGRISLCGCISMYNERSALCGWSSKYNERSDTVPRGPYIHNYVIPKELKLQGFLSTSYKSKADVAITALQEWIKEGKLQVREHIVQGFENMPKAFIGLFEGDNIGKVVVKVQ